MVPSTVYKFDKALPTAYNNKETRREQSYLLQETGIVPKFICLLSEFYAST